MKEDRISYDRIAKSQLFYKALGYDNIETPWMVTPVAVQATLPPGRRMIESLMGCHVGSGEQGFMQQMLDGTLTPGKYQTTTPCFRDEEVYDELTRHAFMKVELIWYQPTDPRLALEHCINNAVNCFFAISDAELFDCVPMDDGTFDVLLNGVELGSYGVRRMGEEHLWIYGTGLAEPRFSLAVQACMVSSDQNVILPQDTPNLPNLLEVPLQSN